MSYSLLTEAGLILFGGFYLGLFVSEFYRVKFRFLLLKIDLTDWGNWCLGLDEGYLSVLRYSKNQNPLEVPFSQKILGWFSFAVIRKMEFINNYSRVVIMYKYSEEVK
jgi:hypothetical protein